MYISFILLFIVRVVSYIPMWMKHIVEQRWFFIRQPKCPKPQAKTETITKTKTQQKKMSTMNFERDALNCVY